ncbi:MAG: polymer-forming cytoskeletal protein [Thermomicrobiales bacterium]|nr:polymer-forming cytoskeletal protein [Thermomicrobiales bacterium]
MRDLTAVDFDWNEDATATFDAASVVDRHSAFEGVFRSQKDLRVEGELKGTIACDGALFVAEGAVVSATIDAEHVTVAGDVQGEVRCRGRLQILPSGRVRARVATGSLVIQEGAVYEGQLDMAGLERAAPRPLRARPAAAPVSIEAAASERQAGGGATFIRRLGSPETAWEATETDGPAAASDTAEAPSS